MALPTVAQVKAYLRVETSAEDAQFTLWIARATALIEGLLGRPIEVEAANVVVQPILHPVTGRWQLFLPVPYIGAVTLTDDNGDAVATGYAEVAATGLVTFDADAPISSWYTATILAGWDAHPDYETKVEPLIAQAITDTVADWYQRRNPSAAGESEAGASATYGDFGVPPRALAVLDPLRRKGVR